MNPCPTLPVTGASTTSLVVMAAALLAFGVLLVVAVRWRRHPVVPVMVANREQTIEFSVLSAKETGPADTIKVSARCAGASVITMLHNNRPVGRISGAQGEVSIEAKQLGQGPVVVSCSPFRIPPGAIRPGLDLLSREVRCMMPDSSFGFESKGYRE